MEGNKEKKDSSIFTIQPEDWGELSSQLSTESERGSVLVGASFLEDCLGALIEDFLVEDAKNTKKLLKGPLAPLGTYYSRTLAAYLLGLISKEEKSDLDLIRDIRNDFAHSFKPLSFSSPIISKKVHKLRIPHLTDEIFDFDSIPPRKLFIQAVSMISTFIEIRRKGIKDRRSPVKEFQVVSTKRTS